MLTPSESTVLRAITLALIAAALAMLAPVWAPLVLAVWLADVLRPVVLGLSRLLRGQRRGAAAIVVLLATGLLVPLTGVALALAADLHDLAEQVRAAIKGHGTLAGALLDDRAAPPLGLREWADLASRHGASAWRTINAVARASTAAALDAVVFVVALYAVAADGERAYAWLEARAPLPREVLGRFAAAFRETGRGLLVGGLGAALVQGGVATIAYVLIGVPRALVLGPLTTVCALVPVVGTAAVWVPLVIMLALSHDYVRAAVLLVVGAGILSLIDNFVRPALARYGRLALPASVVLISMLGGAAAVGASGVLLGPLIVRLAVEALTMAKEGRRLDGPEARRAGAPEPPAGPEDVTPNPPASTAPAPRPPAPR